MAFPAEFVNFGKIDFSNCYVYLYSSPHNRKPLPNVPANIVNAWWQGSNVAVETSTGWVYMYNGFTSYASKYQK